MAKKTKTTPHVTVTPDEARDAVLYARIKGENKTYLEDAAKAAGVKSFSKYMDKLVEQLRANKIV